NGFRNGFDVLEEVVQGELLPQLRDLVRSGTLNESCNPDMLRELVTETVRAHPEMFAPLLKQGRYAVAYPLGLDAIMDCVLRSKLTKHFESELIDRRRRSGEIREHWNGSFVSYQSNLTVADRREIAAHVEQAI